MGKILLQTCCAPCACFPMQDLIDNGFDVYLFFYNPNIHPESEYKKRLEELKKYVNKFSKVELIEGEYEDKKWFKNIKGLEKEPERGKRCDICYEMRMRQTAKYAQENNFEWFGTALSISPHKKAGKISELGNELEEEFKIKFLDRDWKKGNGFTKSCSIAQQEKFYRQNYCGCIYSKKK